MTLRVTSSIKEMDSVSMVSIVALASFPIVPISKSFLTTMSAISSLLTETVVNSMTNLRKLVTWLSYPSRTTLRHLKILAQKKKPRNFVANHVMHPFPKFSQNNLDFAGVE